MNIQTNKLLIVMIMCVLAIILSGYTTAYYQGRFTIDDIFNFGKWDTIKVTVTTTAQNVVFSDTTKYGYTGAISIVNTDDDDTLGYKHTESSIWGTIPPDYSSHYWFPKFSQKIQLKVFGNASGDSIAIAKIDYSLMGMDRRLVQ